MPFFKKYSDYIILLLVILVLILLVIIITDIHVAKINRDLRYGCLINHLNLLL